MAQPPEARDGSDGRDEPVADPPPPTAPPPAASPPDALPSDAPTIAWEPPSEAPSTGEGPATAPPLTPPAGQPYFPQSPTPNDPPSPAAGQGTAQNPLISWAPSGERATPSATDTPAPLVGWQVPEQRVVETAAGYTLAGIGPRLVAYFLDSILVGLIPTILSLVLIDYGAYLRDVLDSMAIDPVTGMPASTMTTVPVTMEVVLITVISTAISFLYFVGFWTSSGQATPGMRGLRMRLVDVTGGTTLTIGQATKRWVGYGAPLALLAFVPPFQAVAGLVQLGVSLILLITAATDDRRQGLHDRWANSLVIRSTTSGAGATALGCLLVVLIGIGFLFVVSAITLGAIAPDLFDLMETYEAVP